MDLRTLVPSTVARKQLAMRDEMKKKRKEIGDEKDDHDGQAKALFRREPSTAGPGAAAR